MNILTSFTVYTAALHALILILFYLLISGLGYPGLVVFQQIKHFTHQKQAAGNPTPAASSRRGTNTVLKQGKRLTPGAPHNGGRPIPPGTASHHPRGMQPPQGMQAAGTVLGSHTHTPAPTARAWRTPTARPVGGQSGEGRRLTPDAPHNGGRHPPRGYPSATPTASNAGPQGRTLWGRCWVPTPAPTAPGTHGLRNPGRPLQRTGGRGRDSA